MQRFLGRITAGIWTLSPPVGVAMEPREGEPGSWHGEMVTTIEVARAIEWHRGGTLLHTDLGLHLGLFVERVVPLGSNAIVQFAARPIAEKTGPPRIKGNGVGQATG